MKNTFRIILAATMIAFLHLAAFADPWVMDFQAEREAEAVLKIEMHTPDYQWLQGPWDAPLEVRIDGQEIAGIIPFGGSVPTEYRIMLGPLGPGKHTATITDPLSSDNRFLVENASLELIYKDSDEYQLLRYSPYIMDRGDNDNTDTLLLTWGTQWKNGKVTVLEYSAVWSNEDGGTPTAELMGRYGRTVDIEWVYRIRIDESGKIIDEKFQGKGHETTDFQGRKIGMHPVFQTCTVNNMVCDDTGDGTVFGIAPEINPGTGSRESMLDANPWVYRVMWEELKKEKKISKVIPDPLKVRIGDPRRYVLVDLESEFMGAGFRLDVGVKIKGDKKTYTAAGDDERMFIFRTGCVRVGIYLPGGTKPEDIEYVSVKAMEGGLGHLSIVSVGPVVMLDGKFNPHIMNVEWKGARKLKPGGKPVAVRIIH